MLPHFPPTHSAWRRIHPAQSCPPSHSPCVTQAKPPGTRHPQTRARPCGRPQPWGAESPHYIDAASPVTRRSPVTLPHTPRSGSGTFRISGSTCGEVPVQCLDSLVGKLDGQPRTQSWRVADDGLASEESEGEIAAGGGGGGRARGIVRGWLLHGGLG